MISTIYTVAPFGFDGEIIAVECDSIKSLPSMQIVGMGNKAIEEAKERVRSAITNSLLDFPKRKLIINLAPAELPKDGVNYDLPISIAILCISGQIKPHEVDGSIFAGELALDGTLRPIRGCINIVQKAKQSGFTKIYLPIDNAEQASLVDGIDIIGVHSLKNLYLHLKGELKLSINKGTNHTSPKDTGHRYPTLDDIKGQELAKRAIIIATAGHHNILLSGPPGTGKTMLAKTITNLLPELTTEEKIEITKINSLSNGRFNEIINNRPFRSPHHTASLVSIVGGGNTPKPGEVSLAHTGVLFLDELPEYPRSVLEALRQPIEDKKIEINRANFRATFPTNFMLVATMNPCPCGYYGDNKRECSCTSTQIAMYQKKLSGPLLDRIDLVVNISRPDNDEMGNLTANLALSDSQHNKALALIKSAFSRQISRYNSSSIYNSSLNNNEIIKNITMSEEAKKLMTLASEKLSLNPRSYFKILKVARTIADLDNNDNITGQYISEALQYRQSIQQ